MTDVVTEPVRNFPGRPARWSLRCSVCKLAVLAGQPVLFATQARGSGPYPGMNEWYVATAHADPCGADLLGCYTTKWDYRAQQCRGCTREMWVRLNARRSHCTDACRQLDYRRRRDLCKDALTRGEVLSRAHLYWDTRPEALAGAR